MDIILTEEALRIHRAAILVDGHNDLPYKIRTKSALETLDLMKSQPQYQTDIPRLLKGGVGAQFWIAVGWMGKQGNGRSGAS
jgi:membrane dipeptidase